MTEQQHRITFLNTFIDSVTKDEAIKIVDGLITNGGQHYIATPNSDIIMQMQKDLELKKICENADLILCDGQIPVKISSFTGEKIKERIAMTDFVHDILKLAEEKQYRIFLLGGKKEVLETASENIHLKHPGIQIVGKYSPPLGFEKDQIETDAINRKIRISNADILLVFLGCPKQEKFIFNNRDNYKTALSIPMGGCIDFLAGTVKRAPKWMQEAGLEWFFRFLQEPKRMFRRYFIEDPQIFKLAWKYRKGKKNAE